MLDFIQNNSFGGLILPIYLFIGFIISFRLHNSVEFRSIKPPSLNSILEGILFKLLMILFYPIILIAALIYIALEKPKKKEYKSYDFPKVKDDGFLYFHKMAGAGTFSCLACNYKENFTSFLHGYNEKGRCGTHGCQCQKCGKFNKFTSNEGVKYIIPKCECGGELSRENKVFCPICKSTDVKYNMIIIS